MEGNTHELTRNVLKIWDTIHRKVKWEYNSPLLALEGTNYFLPGSEKLGEKCTIKRYNGKG